jgi:hypothetical protein
MIIWAVVVFPAPPFVVASVIVLIRNPYKSVAWFRFVPVTSAFQALHLRGSIDFFPESSADPTVLHRCTAIGFP